VGKQVAFQGSQIALTSGSTSTFDIELPQSTAATTAVISDAGGNVVRTLHLGAGVAGTSSVIWDGLSDSGAACPTALYSLSVSGATSSGSSVQATANVRATVTGVDLSNGSAMLIAGGQEIALSKVTAVYSVSTGS
jgi:flagellar basal-body rod modification protein FlgD